MLKTNFRITGYQLTFESDTGYQLTFESDTGYQLTFESDTGYQLTFQSETGYQLTFESDTGYQLTFESDTSKMPFVIISLILTSVTSSFFRTTKWLRFSEPSSAIVCIRSVFTVFNMELEFIS